MKATFSTLFFLRKDRPNSNGLVPILVRITVNGQMVQFNTKLEVQPDLWDTKLGKVKGRNSESTTLNRLIDTLRTKMYSIYNQLLDEKGYALPATIKNILLGIDPDRKMLLEYFKLHNEQYEQRVGKTTSQKTFSRYELTKDRIEEFMKKKYNVSDIMVQEVDFLFVDNFYLFLCNKHNCNNNTAMKFIQRFRAVFNFISNTGVQIRINPFANFKFHFDKVDRQVLTQDEIDLIYKKKFSTQRLERVRDIFIFCCYTGLAYVDVLGLSEDKIRKSFDQHLWIMTKRVKTGEKVNVRLLDIPLAIIDKYSRKSKQSNGKLFPVSCNQKMNEYLKEIAEICGITKPLSTHSQKTSNFTFRTMNE